jgi:cell division septation protein DedD
MANKYPKDRFDVVPDDISRVGAHRTPPKKGRGWIAFGWAALATVILVAIGVVGLLLLNGNLNFKDSGATTPTATASPTPTITPTVNPALNVTVLNGTTESGLATSLANTLTAAGWKVTTGNASASNITSTVVYYSNAANEAAALGVVKSIPGATIELTQTFAETGADLTVVVGSDYKPAG